MFSPISAPVVTVVFSDAVLLSVLESPAVGTSAPSAIVPAVVVARSSVMPMVPPTIREGTLQVTVAGPVTGTGAQPVIPPAVDRSVVAAGTVMSIVVAGAGPGPMPLLSTRRL